MNDISYSFRPNVISVEREFRLERGALKWINGDLERQVPYCEVDELRLYRYRVRGSVVTGTRKLWRCALYSRGQKIRLLPTHWVRLGFVEDRSASFAPFLEELVARVTSANPKVRIRKQTDWRMQFRARVERIALFTAVVFVRAAGYSNRLVDFVAWSVRLIGPRFRGHRVARENLVSAFPEKPAAEIENILAGMWDNIGRMWVEYPHLERLWRNASAHQPDSRIECDALTLGRLARLREEGKGTLVFAAHLANVELLGLAGAAFGLQLSVVHCQLLAERVPTRWYRRPGFGDINPLRGAAFRIQDALKRGAHVGMAVDQHYEDGVNVTFFGRGCKVNPTLARFARAADCSIHGARIVRLPKNRFRFELTDAVEAPRDAQGKIDVVQTMQTVTSVVENWVREHPEQWQWTHRRWR